MSKIIDLYKGRPLELKADGNVRGMVPSLAVEGDKPTLKWHGAMLPRKLYLQTVAFARWCTEEYGGEVQGRLYYSEKKKKWKTCILPQYTSRNLTSEEIEDHEDRGKSMRHTEGGDWVQNGTWHSHAACGAGQSSVDEKDELRQPGLHYTVGSMKAKESSIHCRFVFRGMLYDVDTESVIKNPVVNPSACLSFPEEWKDYLHEDKRVKAVTRTYYNFGEVNGLSGRYHSDGVSYEPVNRSANIQGFLSSSPRADEDIKAREVMIEDFLALETREGLQVISAFASLARLIAGSDNLAESVSLIDEILNDADAINPSHYDDVDLSADELFYDNPNQSDFYDKDFY